MGRSHDVGMTRGGGIGYDVLLIMGPRMRSHVRRGHCPGWDHSPLGIQPKSHLGYSSIVVHAHPLSPSECGQNLVYFVTSLKDNLGVRCKCAGMCCEKRALRVTPKRARVVLGI